jgi:hypothetical protein
MGGRKGVGKSRVVRVPVAAFPGQPPTFRAPDRDGDYAKAETLGSQSCPPSLSAPARHPLALTPASGRMIQAPLGRTHLRVSASARSLQWKRESDGARGCRLGTREGEGQGLGAGGWVLGAGVWGLSAGGWWLASGGQGARGASGWMGGWADGRMGGWVDGWLVGWMGERTRVEPGRG